MKTKLLTLTAFAAFIASSASAALVPYDDFVDLEIIDREIAPTLRDSQGAIERQGGITGVLDITGAYDTNPDAFDLKYDKQGFLPDLYKVTNVALGFSFYKWVGSSTAWAMVDIDLNLGDAGLVSRSGSDSVGTGSFTNDPMEFNFLLDTMPLSGPTSLSQQVAVKLIADVQADGMIRWGVDVGEAAGIHLFGAVLGVEAHRIPDSGSTMALLGAGVFGLVLVRRRLR